MVLIWLSYNKFLHFILNEFDFKITILNIYVQGQNNSKFDSSLSSSYELSQITQGCIWNLIVKYWPPLLPPALKSSLTWWFHPWGRMCHKASLRQPPPACQPEVYSIFLCKSKRTWTTSVSKTDSHTRISSLITNSFYSKIVCGYFNREWI